MLTGLKQEYLNAVWSDVNKALVEQAKQPAFKADTAKLLASWYARTRKRPSLVAADFEQRLAQLPASLVVQLEDHGRRVRLSASGDASRTLTEVCRGTTWFDGYPKFPSDALNALATAQPR